MATADPTLYPTLATGDTIEVGDFIAARSMTIVTGFVIGTGFLGVWNRKPWIPTYLIRDWRGQKGTISVEDAVLIHKSDDWWARMVPEYQEYDAMSSFIKVGDQFINLSHARTIKQAGDKVWIDWGGDDELLVMGPEAVALVDYLTRSTSDVVNVYTLQQAELARLEAEVAAEAPAKRRGAKKAAAVDDAPPAA